MDKGVYRWVVLANRVDFLPEWLELCGGEGILERVCAYGAVVWSGRRLLFDGPQCKQRVGEKGPGGGLWVLLMVVEDVFGLADHLMEDVRQSICALEDGER